jgi:hypothetical protein
MCNRNFSGSTAVDTLGPANQTSQSFMQEATMITAVVRFPLPPGITRDDAKGMYEKSAPNYRGVPGLIRKYYLYGADRTGGGVYLWDSREAAERFYSEAWRRMIAQRFGTQPEVLFYETSVIVENADETATTAVA